MTTCRNADQWYCPVGYLMPIDNDDGTWTQVPVSCRHCAGTGTEPWRPLFLCRWLRWRRIQRGR